MQNLFRTRQISVVTNILRVTLLIAGFSLVQNIGAQAQNQTMNTANADQGAALFTTQCAVCHGANGRPVSSNFPSLSEPNAVEDAETVITNIHQGVAVMPSFGWLTDQEIMDITNYVRNSWGNKFDEVTVEEVHQVRASLDVPEPALTMWDGVYTKDQAKKGMAVYNGACGLCHGRRLNGVPDDQDMLPGPPLARAHFLRNWNGRSLGTLFSYTRATMPKSNPGFISDEDYAAIVAHMLATSGAIAGKTALSDDPVTLGNIRILPKPE